MRCNNTEYDYGGSGIATLRPSHTLEHPPHVYFRVLTKSWDRLIAQSAGVAATRPST